MMDHDTKKITVAGLLFLAAMLLVAACPAKAQQFIDDVYVVPIERACPEGAVKVGQTVEQCVDEKWTEMRTKQAWLGTTDVIVPWPFMLIMMGVMLFVGFVAGSQ